MMVAGSSRQSHGNRRQWRKSICGVCPAGCWVEVVVNDGKLEDIRADQGHPLGMICRRGKHAPEIVHSKDRLRFPMKRVGPKGDFEFERISWDQAFQMIVDKFQQIKKESGAEALAVYTGRGAFELALCDTFQPKEIAVSSASSVLFPFGSPNTLGVGALCYVSYAMIAPHVTMGRMLINMFADIENADLLLVWGTNPATDSPPLDMHRLEAAAQRGAEIVVIDPRRTETAKRTRAQWVPIRPGTDGALALSMIEVLIGEDLYDDDFAENWCHGFAALRTYTQHFRPEVAATITGIPADTIRDLARRIGRTMGACPIMYTGLEYSNSGVQAIRAVLTLFALAGHLDTPGGIGLAMPSSQFPISRPFNQPNPAPGRAIGRDRFPLYSHYRGEGHALGLVNSVLQGEPYQIRGLLIEGASILTSWPQTAVWREALSRLDFVVCVDRQLTADAAYADIVLPATTGFEIDSYMVYGGIFRLREKVIEPVGEARNDLLILAELAQRLGYGDLYPQNEEAAICGALEGSGYSLESIRASDGMVKVPTPMMEYKKWQKGSLRPDGQPGFDTATGKFEIWSTILEEYGFEPLPKYIEPVEGPIANPKLADRYPLVFNSGARSQTDFRSQHHGIEGLSQDNSEPVVELHTDDAQDRGIATGDLVEVQTARGAVLFRAEVNGDIIKGAVECSMGGGTPVGPTAWQDWNVNDLTDIDNYDEISGFPVYKALLCEVVRREAATVASRRSTQKTEASLEVSSAVSTAVKASSRVIYLDNSATTQVADDVREAMLPYLSSAHGNPSSIHAIGRQAQTALAHARRQVAALVNARPRSIIFTSGGSEANNLALKGVAFARTKTGHIVTTSIEHPAVLNTCRFLERLGYRVTYLEVDADGLVDPNMLYEALTADTFLVSVMMANNEVGTLQPIKALSEIVHDAGALFHTDAVQSAGKVGIDVGKLEVDLLSLSGHKFHGPKGTGALYVRPGVVLEPLVHGGSQEANLRAGTENVAGAIGMGLAAELALNTLVDADRVRQLRDRLEEGIRNLIPDAQLNGDRDSRLCNILNLSLPDLRGESVVVAMDHRGISLSSGSACKSGSPEPTHVLMAMGRSEAEAHCAVRFSLSRNTTENDINETIMALADVLDEMKTSVRFLSCK